jgi:hypothetical protein
MNDGFTVDPERLVDQAGLFDDLVGRVGRIHRTLVDSLAATGECWGGDAVGRSFGSAHTAPATGTLTQLSSLAERLRGVGTRFAATGTAYAASDAGAVERLRTVEPDV